MLQAYYNTFCKPDRQLLPKLRATEFAHDTSFVLLTSNIVLMLLFNTRHVACDLLTLFRIIQFSLQFSQSV